MNIIHIEALVRQRLDLVWQAYHDPAHVVKWNFASADWHCPAAKASFVEGGSFSHRMEAKDGSFGFDFEGVYDRIEPKSLIRYHLLDDRVVDVVFEEKKGFVRVAVAFEAETMNSPELQQEGWQAILNQFKRHAESLQA